MLYKPVDASPYMEAVDIKNGFVLRVQISGTSCAGAKFLVYDSSKISTSEKVTAQSEWPWVELNKNQYILSDTKYNGDWVSLYIGPDQSDEGPAKDCDFAVDAALDGDGNLRVGDFVFKEGGDYTWKVLLYSSQVREGDFANVGYFKWDWGTAGSTKCLPYKYSKRTDPAWTSIYYDYDGTDGEETLTFHVGYRINGTGKQESQIQNAALLRKYAGRDLTANPLYAVMLRGEDPPEQNFETFWSDEAELGHCQVTAWPSVIDDDPAALHWGDVTVSVAGEEFAEIRADIVERGFPPGGEPRYFNGGLYRVLTHQDRSYAYISEKGTADDPRRDYNYMTYGSVVKAATYENQEAKVTVQYSALVQPGMYIIAKEGTTAYEIDRVLSYDVTEAKMELRVAGVTDNPEHWSGESNSEDFKKDFPEGGYYQIYSPFVPSDEYHLSCHGLGTLTMKTAMGYDFAGVYVTGEFTPAGDEEIVSHRLVTRDNKGNVVYDSGNVYDNNLALTVDCLIDGEMYMSELEVTDSYGRRLTAGPRGHGYSQSIYHLWKQISAVAAARPARSSFVLSLRRDGEVIEEGRSYTLTVYAHSFGANRLRRVGEITGVTSLAEPVIIEDYGVGSGESVRYYVYAREENGGEDDNDGSGHGQHGLMAVTPYVYHEWDGYFVIFMDEDGADGTDGCRARAVWSFTDNVSEGAVSHKLDYSEYAALARYPKTGMGVQDYESGTLETGAGKFWCDGTLEDTVEMQRRWRECCASGKRAVYKDQRGNAFVVTVSVPSRQSAMYGVRGYDGRLIVPSTLSFTWTEVDDLYNVRVYNRPKYNRASDPYWCHRGITGVEAAVRLADADYDI